MREYKMLLSERTRLLDVTGHLTGHNLSLRMYAAAGEAGARTASGERMLLSRRVWARRFGAGVEPGVEATSDALA